MKIKFKELVKEITEKVKEIFSLRKKADRVEQDISGIYNAFFVKMAGSCNSREQLKEIIVGERLKEKSWSEDKDEYETVTLENILIVDETKLKEYAFSIDPELKDEAISKVFRYDSGREKTLDNITARIYFSHYDQLKVLDEDEAEYSFLKNGFKVEDDVLKDKEHYDLYTPKKIISKLDGKIKEELKKFNDISSELTELQAQFERIKIKIAEKIA